jgi:hypothetical protein
MLQRQRGMLRMLQPMIVKVQRPLAASDLPRASWLVYARGRERMRQFHPTADVEAQMAGDPKAYFEAEWRGDHWEIGQRVEEQDW